MLTKNEIKYIRSLKDKKHREDAGYFVAEGPKVMEELLSTTDYLPSRIYATAGWLEGIGQSIDASVAIVSVSEDELKAISFLQTPQQVLAVVPMPTTHFNPFPSNAWSLMLDGIQDPGNLGTIIRIADWFGVAAIYATPETADCFNPKVVQATMGSLFRVKVMYGPCIDWLKQAEVPVYGAALHGQSVWNLEKAVPGVLIIGHEGKGMSPEMAALTSRLIAIPKIGEAESLNAGVAAGILLSHLMQAGSK